MDGRAGRASAADARAAVWASRGRCVSAVGAISSQPLSFVHSFYRDEFHPERIRRRHLRSRPQRTSDICCDPLRHCVRARTSSRVVCDLEWVGQEIHRALLRARIRVRRVRRGQQLRFAAAPLRFGCGRAPQQAVLQPAMLSERALSRPPPIPRAASVVRTSGTACGRGAAGTSSRTCGRPI